MFENDLLLAFLFMAILFLRQIYILKQPNKINYAPLMVGIGAISSVVHFIIHPDVSNVVMLLRESFFPLLVGLLLYIVMNILHQTQQSENARAQSEFTQTIISQVAQLKEFMSELEERISISQQEDRESQKEIREKFSKDIKALDAIQTNQGKFLEKFDDLSNWHKDVTNSFEDFTHTQLPELDNVVHKHIDILRVAEQEHFNKLTAAINKAFENRYDVQEDLDFLKENLDKLKNMSDTIAGLITRQTLQELGSVTKAFEKQMLALKSQTEGVGTSLSESESRLGSIRDQSEIIMKQMVLSSNKMNELEKQNHGLHDIYATIKELMVDMEVIKADYVKSQAQLSIVSKEIKYSENEQITAMKNQIDTLGEALTRKIDDSLAKLHEHYHIAGEDITQSVQMLAKKAKLQKGYTQLDS
ncbi:hypothetical protein KJ877_04705 [bacterium]|nr:hypothetical protein [bacterium]MBU1990385.1 hypothetical protein [bacterium]